jgi:dienelactone hydrolase
MLHGAGGVLGAREHTYGSQLAAMGAAALVIDTFAARRNRAAGFTERLLEITESMAIADAYAGLRWLAQRPEIDCTASSSSASPTARWQRCTPSTPG